MRRIALITAVAVLGTLAAAASAHADRYWSRVEAQKLTKQAVVKRYDLRRGYIRARCHLPGHVPHDPDYEYRVWYCPWYDGRTECFGSMAIYGANGRGWFRHRVRVGINC